MMRRAFLRRMATAALGGMLGLELMARQPKDWGPSIESSEPFALEAGKTYTLQYRYGDEPWREMRGAILVDARPAGEHGDDEVTFAAPMPAVEPGRSIQFVIRGPAVGELVSKQGGRHGR